MRRRTLAISLVLACMFVALFGLSATTAAAHHHGEHCPLTGAEPSLCVTVLDHIEHWHTIFAVVLSTLVVFGVLLLASRILWLSQVSIRKRRQVARPMRWHQTQRPSLLQELFSQGLLNPRVP